MEYTLYDDLMNKKYFITESLKNGLPNGGRYNQWVFDEILSQYIDYCGTKFKALFSPGVYSLGVVRKTFYIGKTSRPIILRIIDHLFETIPTPRSKDAVFNDDKIMITKISLLLDKKIDISVLSNNPDDEEDIIIDKYNVVGYELTNKQYCKDRTTYQDFFYNYFKDKGQQCYCKDLDIFKDETCKNYIVELRETVKDRIDLLKRRFGYNNFSTNIDSMYTLGFKEAKNEEEKNGE